MRILHLDTEKGFRGGEQQVINLLNGLRESGVEDQLVVVRKGHAFEERVKGEGFTTTSVKDAKPILFARFTRLRRKVEEFNPDIVHAHTGNSHTIAWKLFGNTLPVVVTRRVDFALKKNFFSRQKYLHPGTHYIAISNAIRDIMIRGGVNPDNISVIPSGIDPDRFQKNGIFPNKEERKNWRDKIQATAKTTVYAMVGSLVDHKDPTNLVDAASILRDKGCDFRILLIGDGDMRSDVEMEIRRQELGPYFHITGWQDDVSKALSAADIFVMPSKLEGLCTSLLDAQALGLPCVTTDAGGMTDIIRDSETGYLAKKENPESFANAMMKIIEDSDLKNQMVKNGKKQIQDRFTIESMTRSYLDLYESILSRKG